MNDAIQPSTTPAPQEEGINLTELFFKYMRHWKWFLLSVAFCLSVAAVYLRYSTRIYSVTASILLKDDKRGGGMVDLKAFDELSLFDTKSNVDNELEILKSISLMEDVVKTMHLYFTYTVKGTVKTSEIYGKECPVLLSLPEEVLDTIQAVPFTMDVHPDGKVVFRDVEDYDEVVVTASRYDSAVTLPFGTVLMRPGQKLPQDVMTVYVRFTRPVRMAQGILSNLDIALTGKTTSVVKMTYKTPHRQKGVDLIAHFIDTYNAESVRDQNRVALNTADFLDERLDSLTSELAAVEKRVESYKQSEQVTDVVSEAQLFLSQSSNVEAKLLEVETQLSVINDLNQYLERYNDAAQLLPVGTGIGSTGLVQQINQYNELVLAYQKLSRTAAPSNQAMVDLEHNIDALRASIHTSIGRELRQLNLQKAELEKQNALYAGKIRSIPRKERESMEIMRQQTVKASLYLFLLQKKEENYLSMTVVQPKAKVIDVARPSNEPIAPRTPMIYMLALLAGMAFPIGIIYIKELFNLRIENKEELEKLTRVPVLGEIPKSDEAGNIVLHEHSTNTLAEMFRLLRTNLLFVAGQERKVIMVTSSVGGEGKTFMSINLGLSLAFLNKKVVIIGLDVRKPRLAHYLDLELKEGVTMYLAGALEREKLVVPSGVHPKLHIIPAGPIPPNPNELLARKELDELIEQCKQDYDFVILDTAPVGAVSDSYLLNRFADITLYLVRAEYTLKQNIVDAEQPYLNGQLNNMYFVLNASDLKKSSYRYGYGKKYGYGKQYGYGYGYGEEEVKS